MALLHLSKKIPRGRNLSNIEHHVFYNFYDFMIFQMRLDFVEGGMWHVVVGEAFSQDVTFEVCFSATLATQSLTYPWLGGSGNLDTKSDFETTRQIRD